LNGYGGRVERGESIAAAAARELKEESGVTVSIQDLIYTACTTVHRGRDVIFEIHIFLAYRWTGQPRESDEMGAPRWFPIKKLPFDNMLPGNSRWIPRALRNKKFEANVYLSGSGKKFKRIVFRKVTFT
jgi:8-oxo-dGTP pyrophosphatase MutT (NUDIX family)